MASEIFLKRMCLESEELFPSFRIGKVLVHSALWELTVKFSRISRINWCWVSSLKIDHGGNIYTKKKKKKKDITGLETPCKYNRFKSNCSTLYKHSWEKCLLIMLKQIKISYFNENLFQLFPLAFFFKIRHL